MVTPNLVIITISNKEGFEGELNIAFAIKL